MNTIHISELRIGMKFRNIYGEHYSTIAEIATSNGVIKSTDPYYGYTGSFYWFAVDRIQVQNDEGEWCYIDESEKDAEV